MGATATRRPPFDQPIDLDEIRRPRTVKAVTQAGWMVHMNHAYRRHG